MNKGITAFFLVIVLKFFISCKTENKKSNIDYNQKANELIQQIIIEENCNCILEIPKKSTIECEELENPKFNIVNFYKKRLSMKNIKEIDSLKKTYQNFELNAEFIKANNIRIVKRDSIRILYKDLNFLTKTCKDGVEYCIKPNFTKNYNIAVIGFGPSGMCSGLQTRVYEYKNNKWIRKGNKNYW
jgi:hypothetical protein